MDFYPKAHVEQTPTWYNWYRKVSNNRRKIITTPENRIERWTIDIERLMKGEDVRVHTLIDKELVELDKLYARIHNEKQILRDSSR